MTSEEPVRLRQHTTAGRGPRRVIGGGALWWLLVVATVVLVAACSGDGEEAQSAEDDCVLSGDCTPGPEETEASTTGTHDGLPVGFTAEGLPLIGDPDAPVTMIEYTDYLCPFCLIHTTETVPLLLEEYGATGEVNFVFHDFPLAGLHPTAPTGHTASVCVAEQSAPLFWQFHDFLFENQEQWASIPDPSDYLAQAAAEVGADMSAYETCIASPDSQAIVDERVAAGEALGFNGTPTFRLIRNDTGDTYEVVGAQGLEVFQAELDALVAGEEPPTAAPATDLSSQLSASTRTFSADPDRQDTYDGLTVGFTDEGFPFIGDPDAPITLFEYSDYLCPFCLRHTTETTPILLEKYVEPGAMNLVFRDFPLENLHPTAPQGHAASICVSEQGAAFFWAFHDSLFFNQREWSDLPDPTDWLRQTAGQVGVDLDAYRECVEDGRTVPVVTERVGQGEAAGFNATPSFQFVVNETGDVHDLVGAYPLETFEGYLDALAAGEDPPDPEGEQEPPELPLWANDEGLRPDPERPGYTVAGDAYKGDPDAPLVVVEFSDFQCPACASHALDAQPAIDEAFVDEGQVLWVYKHYPLPIHPQSPVAAAAAECAGRQGEFWAMHDLLFANQEQWSIDEPDPVFVNLASQIDLDEAAFTDCLESREPLERVLDDIYDANGLATNTPTFFMIYGGTGARFEGARDAEAFVSLLEDQMENALTADTTGEG